MNYELSFWRLAGGSNKYKRAIQVQGANGKLCTLYDDIFGSQARTDFSEYSEDIQLIDNETRFISEDTINTHFYHDYYIPPENIAISNSTSEFSTTYKGLYNNLLQNNDSGKKDDEQHGSNRVSFITGTIGDGKTALISKIIFDIFAEKRKVIPIYISIEEEWTETDKSGAKKPKSGLICSTHTGHR